MSTILDLINLINQLMMDKNILNEKLEKLENEKKLIKKSNKPE